MNMINTVKYLLNVRGMWYFPLKITEKKYIYNASSVYLECYCCHAGLVRRWVSILVLKERNKEQLTQDIIGTDRTGLKSFIRIEGGKRYCWNWSFCIDWSVNGRSNEYMQFISCLTYMILYLNSINLCTYITQWYYYN